MIEPTSDLTRVESLISIGRFAEACQMLQPILASEPDNARGFCLLAQCWLGLGDPEAARSAATTAVGLDPERAWAHRLLSLALEELGQHKKAVEAGREGVRLNPHDWLGHAQFAVLAAADRSNRGEARTAATEAVRLAPTEPRAHLAVARVALADKRRKEAESAVEYALALAPEDTDAHNMLATLRWGQSKWLRGGTLAEAADGYATAIRTDPHSTASRHNLDSVLRTFLGRLSYYILIVAYITRGSLSGPTPGPRALPALLLLVPGFFAARFIQRLSPTLRTYLISIALRSRLTVPVALMTVAVGGLLLIPLLPGPQHDGLAIGITGCSALAARIYLAVHTHKRAREFTGKQGFFANDALWFLAIVSGLGAIGCLFLTPIGFGFACAAVLGTFSVLSFNSLYRRRRPKQSKTAVSAVQPKH